MKPENTIPKGWRGKIAYAPKGKAGEYNPLACNHVSGCPHCCEYCYVPSIPGHPAAADFHDLKLLALRKNALVRLALDLESPTLRANRGAELLFCFTADPFPYVDPESKYYPAALDIYGATAIGVQMCIQRGQACTVLTKNPAEALAQIVDPTAPGFRLGVTITTTDAESRAEPGAPSSAERIAAALEAAVDGVRVWISAEPTTPENAIDIVSVFAGRAVEIKIGKLNHRGALPDVAGWWGFAMLLNKYADESTGSGVYMFRGTRVTIKRETWELVQKGGPV